jgi:hypothetical protein
MEISQRFEHLFDLPQDPQTLSALLPFIPKFHHGLLDLSSSGHDTERD